MHTSSTQGTGTATAGHSPALAAMSRAEEEITRVFAQAPPAGAVADLLDLTCQLWESMERIKLHALLRLAQIHASGNLLEVGGQRTPAGWLAHTLGVNQNQARSMAALAQLLFEEKLPETRKALDAGILSVDEAAAVAKVIEQSVKTRNKKRFPDADVFRLMMDAAIMAAKADNPTLSGAQMMWVGRQIGAQYNPALVEDQHQKAFDARRVDMARTFQGSYYLQAWGPDADAELIDKALAAFTKPHNPNKPEVSKAERTYDGLMAMVKAALGHQGCTKPAGPVAMINITVPLDVFTGQRQTNTTTAQDGPEEGSAPDQGGQGENASTPNGQQGGFAATQDGQVIAMEAVRNMSPDSILRRVITDPDTGKPLDVGRGMRNAPEQIRTVANHGHTTCAWYQGCDAPISDTEADHIQSFSRGGKTSAANIQPLCPTHNRLKWRMENNPHRAQCKGRTAHQKPDPPPDPEPPPEPPPDAVSRE